MREQSELGGLERAANAASAAAGAANAQAELQVRFALRLLYKSNVCMP